MKILNEVIKAKELCELNCSDEGHCQDCPYAEQDANGDLSFFCHDCELDALYYLKEYKSKQNVGTMMLALHNINKTVCDDCWLSREMVGEGFKQIYKKYIEEQNPPLTWDELKQMINSIVWLERSSNGNWAEIIYATDDKIEYFCFGTDELYCIMKKDYIPDKWQAYRKEQP
jgi:uncharacterized protein with HEPN domain